MLDSRTYDLRQRFPAVPAWIVEILVALALIGVATGVRLVIDLAFRDVVAFPLTFPALTVATLLAGGRCGLLVVVGAQLMAWYFLVPIRGSFEFANASNAVSLALATGAQLLLLWFVARYRTAQLRAASLMAAQQSELARSVELLTEQMRTREQLVTQEDELRMTRRNLDAIYQASGDGLALCEATFDDEGHVVEYQVLEVNRAHGELTAATREQMLTTPVSAIDPPIDPRWFKTAERVLKTGVMQDFDVRSRATGRWLNIRVSRVSDRLFQQTFVDVSDRHRLEEQRVALLKEMSHRVMNNFQMVAGFLHIQAGSADPAAKPHLRTAERRVHALAQLHSLLAYTESEGDIDAGAYVRELCGYLSASIERPDAVSLVCEVDELRLSTDQVVPLGFVVSELVSNSAKYAFPPPLSGTIQVSLRARPDGWTLIVEDDGCGFETSATPKGGGLGTRLVERFVQQMGAKLSTVSSHGVRHEVVYDYNAELVR